jgi:hypothetical protein
VRLSKETNTSIYANKTTNKTQAPPIISIRDAIEQNTSITTPPDDITTESQHRAISTLSRCSGMKDINMNDWRKIPIKFENVNISREQRKQILKGNPLELHNIKKKSGEVVDVMLQWNEKEHKLNIMHILPKQKQAIKTKQQHHYPHI